MTENQAPDDQTETDEKAPDTPAQRHLEDPEAELHESDAGSEHVGGESYRNTLRLN